MKKFQKKPAPLIAPNMFLKLELDRIIGDFNALYSTVHVTYLYTTQKMIMKNKTSTTAVPCTMEEAFAVLDVMCDPSVRNKSFDETYAARTDIWKKWDEWKMSTIGENL